MPFSPPQSPRSHYKGALLAGGWLPPALDPQAPPVMSVEKYVPTDLNIPDNYVQHTLKTTKPLPPVTLANVWGEINWISVTLLTVPPIVGIYGLFTTALQWRTGLLMFAWYLLTGLGITAGYHRLWAHRSYNAIVPLQIFLAFAGAGAAQGSIRWWSRGHRSHHRYTDTDLDPYNAQRGFFYSHIGWMLLKPRRKIGVADISDLSKSPLVRWQHKHYLPIMLFMAFILPAMIGSIWGDARGAFFYAGVIRLVIVHHSTFCVNSLAHWIGDQPFDDKHTPRDHFLTALVTVGEGYHNFHHQFPMDYRNAIKWWQYDPTKWFIWANRRIGFASHLKVFPDNEVRKGQLAMQLKRLRRTQDNLQWPTTSNDLPVVTWETFQEQSKHRPLILIAGFIHDISEFLEEHPGGEHLIRKFIGRDASTAFFGGVYDHSHAAHNLLAMKRVGILEGGVQIVNDIEKERRIPPSQRLRIARWEELSSGSSSGEQSD
ncbi:hypothetical protein EV714DRAFT_244637 [Schizophyllum commune]